MHHILKNTILSTHWFLSLYLFIYIYCSISIIKINKFTSLHILVTLWWEGGGDEGIVWFPFAPHWRNGPLSLRKIQTSPNGSFSSTDAHIGRLIFCGGVRHFYGHLHTISGNLQGLFISYVVVRQIDALHRMPSQGPHWPFCLLMTILHLGNKTA